MIAVLFVQHSNDDEDTMTSQTAKIPTEDVNLTFRTSSLICCVAVLVVVCVRNAFVILFLLSRQYPNLLL